MIGRFTDGDNIKRLIFIFLAVGALGMLCFVSTYKKDVLTQPTFPLDEEVITVALEKSRLPGILSKSETTSSAEGQSMHVVRSPTITYSDIIGAEEAYSNPSTRLLIAAVSSVATGDERVLITVFDQIDVPDQMAWEDWKQQIVFATLLYGGFEDEEQVYQAFAGKELPSGENLFERWDAQLPGGYCTVTYRTSKATNHPTRKQHASMGVNIYESQALYQRLQKPTTQAVP